MAESTQAEFSFGHMNELAVRKTRIGSDIVRSVIIPSLIPIVREGQLSLHDCFLLHEPYFDDTLLTASFYKKNRSVVYGVEKMLPESLMAGFNSAYWKEKGTLSVRTNHVYSGDKFIHPFWDLSEMGNQLIYRINEFMMTQDRFSESEVRSILYKIHMIAGALHLPSEGSGRFIGDLDTLLQDSLQTVRTHDELFVPQYISTSGYRCENDEQWSIEEELWYRSFLITDVVNELKTINSDVFVQLPIEVRYPKTIHDAVSLLQYTMPQLTTENLQSDYLDTINTILLTQIASICDIESKTWFNTLAEYAQKRKQFSNRSNQYFWSSELPDNQIELLDSLVAMHHCGDMRTLQQILSAQEHQIHSIQQSKLGERILLLLS